MDDIKDLRKKLKLELNIHNQRKCEYCDWNPNCCKWCGKLKNNKRKLGSIETFVKKREIIPSKKNNSILFS